MSQSILGDDQKALQLLQLLQALQSPDNVQRTQAEEVLSEQWTTAQPDALLCGLAEQVQRTQEQAMRAFAAVLFRRIAMKTRKDTDNDTTTELFTTIQIQAQHTARQKMLECLVEEKVAHVRDKISDAVAEIARQYSDRDEQWPELLGTLSHLSQSSDAGQRATAFRVFATTPDIIGKEHETAVIAAFTRGLKDDDISVRLASMEAYSSFFQSLTKSSQKKYFPMIGDVLAILPPVRESKDDDQLTRALVALLDLAEVAPKMFKDHFRDLVKFSVSVVQDEELDDTPRQNALELMTTFADNHPAMCRKDPEFTDEMVKQCLAFMTDVGVDDDDARIWNESEDLDADESDANHVAGEQCVDRLANKLGGNTLVRPVFLWIPKMMESSSWREKHAALMALSAISEGCRDIMEPELQKVLETVLPALNDPHPRVRWAGCNALGQMSTDFATTMQEKYAEIVVPALIHVLDAPEPRVQSHAAAALVNFCEEAEKEVLEPYLNDLLTKLHGLLQKPQRFVQEQALSTIATVADSAETAFANYYDVLMPLMFTALQQPQEKDSRLLKAKAMECATLIALAVKREKMGQDALTLMQILDNIQSSIEDADDPQAGYLQHCWGRMCRVMGSGFVHYLSRVIPPLLVQAGAKADIQLLDDEEEVARVENEEGWELVPLKGKYIGINTTMLDDKHTAIELIFIYAQNLEADFEPYVVNIMDNVLIPSLAFFFHDPVRVAAAKAIPQLLNAYKQKHGVGSSEMQQLWARTIEKLLETLSTEPAVETLAEMYESFYESVEVMGQSCLSEEHMNSFITSAEGVLKDYQKRVKQRLDDQAERNPDEDEEDDEETAIAIEDDASLLSDMNKAFHTIMKHHGPAFIPYWKSLLSYYAGFVTDPDPTNRQWSLCILDDLIEFCGSHSLEYADMIRPALDAGMQDDNPANRQASCYGVGVLALNGGQGWAEYAAAALEGLFAATRHTAARTEEHVFATENASAAISKVLKFNNSHIQNAAQITDAWIDTLPITNDDEAAPFAYAYLGELIDQGFPPTHTKAAQIFVAIAEALAAETLQGQQALRAAAAMKALARAVGDHVMTQALMSSCSVETQAALGPYLG